MSRILVTLCALLFAQSLAANPIAEFLCSPTGQMRDRLEDQFRAERLASGLRDIDQVMEIWTDDMGDWTLVVRYANGTSCILAMGEHWQTEEPKLDPA